MTTIFSTAIHQKSLLKEDGRPVVTSIGFSGEYLREYACHRRGCILGPDKGEQQHGQDSNDSNV